MDPSLEVGHALDVVPAWLRGAVFYQIFPDRFANGDANNDPANVMLWDSRPSLNGYFGGDLAGIQKRLDYLVDLGVNALYLNPIFQSAAPHRYHITDYYRIDPKLGTMQDFLNLLDEVHRRGMRLVLDGVFNHCGRGFFAFNDVLENQAESPYKDWFHIKRFPVDAFSPGEAEDYLAWWNIKSLPKFNTSNPEVRRYLLDVARYWIEQGIDGWRLDVPNEIDDDHFWAAFRQVVRNTNPEAALIGEIWEINPRWVGDGHFDGLMNYPVRDAVLDLLKGRTGVVQFADLLDQVVNAYPWEHTLAMYNTLGTHDTKRVRTSLDGDLRRVGLAFIFLIAYPGVPAVYYGDEIGMEGDKDPDSRRTFPWTEELWDTDLRELVKRLIAERKHSKALQSGTYQRVWMDESRGGFAFLRCAGEEQVMVIMNSGDTHMTAAIPVGAMGWQNGDRVEDMIRGGVVEIRGEMMHIDLAEYSGVWLLHKGN
jgi:glycosidase